MSSTKTDRKLTRELAEMAARASAPVAARLTSAFDEIARSGDAFGLAVGECAPEFVLPNAVGQRVDLEQRLGLGPVVLAFYRGEWCPYCNLTLHALQSALPRFQAYGASVIAI
ncbi:MAG: redoxin domain-containing protein, partial [Candidatus Dormibacteraceae bacterium]